MCNTNISIKILHSALQQNQHGATCNYLEAHLDVSVDNLVVVEISESLQDLFGVEGDGGLVVLQGPPLGAQQRRQAA